MNRVMITGITGFIGSNLAKRLIETGYKVYGLIRHIASRDMDPIKSIQNDVVLLIAELSDYHSISDAFRRINPNIIYHLAALTPVRYSFEHPFQYAIDNYLGTMNVIHALKNLPDFKKRKLIVASTAEVYGIHETEEPFCEDMELRPSSPYAVSKAAADMYARMASQVYDMNITTYRPVNTYGRLNENRFLIEYLITNMLKDQEVYIGAPKSVRDFIYVSDHVAAYELALKKDLAIGEAYNVSSGIGISNEMIANKIAKLIGYDSKRINLGFYPPGYPLRPIRSDQKYLVLNSDKIRKLGWKNKVDLDNGLKKIIEFYKSKK